MPKIGEVITDFKPIDNEEIITDFKPVTDTALISELESTPDVPRETSPYGMKPSLTPVLSMFDNPKQEADKIKTAISDSYIFGVDPSMTYSFKDEFAKAKTIRNIDIQKLKGTSTLGKSALPKQTGEAEKQDITVQSARTVLGGLVDTAKLPWQALRIYGGLSEMIGGTRDIATYASEKMQDIETFKKGLNLGTLDEFRKATPQTLDEAFSFKAIPWWINSVLETGTSMAPTIAVGGAFAALGKPIVGLLLGGAIGGLMESENTYNEAKKKGWSNDDAAIAATEMMIASGVLNSLSLSRMLKKLPPNLAGKIFNLIGTGAVEYVTELAEEPSEALILQEGIQGAIAATKQAAIPLLPVFLTGMAGGIGGAEITKKTMPLTEKQQQIIKKQQGLLGDEWRHITGEEAQKSIDRASNMPLGVETVYEGMIDGLTATGMSEEKANTEAIQAIIQTDEGREYIQNVIEVGEKIAQSQASETTEESQPEITPEQETEDLFNGFDKIAESDALETMTDDEIIEELSSTAIEPSVPSEAQKQAALSPKILFHGTSAKDNIATFKGDVVYLSDNPQEAKAFAESAILGGSRGEGKSRVLNVAIPEGKTKNIDEIVQAAVMEGDIDTVISEQAKIARTEGYEFLSFNHPSSIRGKGDFEAIVAINPNKLKTVPRETLTKQAVADAKTREVQKGQVELLKEQSKSKPRELHTYKVGDVVEINGKKVEIKKIIKDSFGEPQRVSVQPVEKVTKTIKDKTFDMPQKPYDISPFTEIVEGEAKLAVGKIEAKDISAAEDVIKNVFARIDTILGKGTVSVGFKPSKTILDALSTNVKQKALGEHGLSLSDKFSVAGLYQHTHTLTGNGLKHIITFAEELKSDPKGLKRTGFHEGWHGAEEILESLAASGNQEAKDILKTLKSEIQLAEDRAEAFADFGMGKTPETLSAKVRAIFERIMAFFRQLGDYLAGRGITSKAEVNIFFEKVWTGEFADRTAEGRERTALSIDEFADFKQSMDAGKFESPAEKEIGDYAELLKKDYDSLTDKERNIVNNLMADEGMLSIKDINKQTRKTMSEWTFKEVIESDAEIKAMIIKAVRAAREAYKAGNKAGVEAEKAKIISLYQRRKKISAIKDTLAIPDNVMKKITRNRDIGLMSNYEFKQYMDEIYIKSVEIAETAQAKAELTDLIFTKRLQKVENYRKALKLPAIEKMTTEQLRQFAEALEPFADGDTFLTERELETVDKTDLKGIRTWREARLKLAQEAGASIAEIEALKVKESDEYRYDTALAESNPFYNLLVTETTRKLMEADARYYDVEKKAHELAKKSNASRQRTTIEKLIPQDKQIMEYLEAPAEMKNALAEEMTPEQIDYAHFMQEYFGDYLEYLIKVKALTKGRENYFVHMRRTFLEDVKEAGLIKAFSNIFTNYQQDEAVFNIMDEDTGNILPLEKFFQFALHRSGNLEPTANITRAFLTYVRMAEKKRSLDELIPKMDIYAQSLTPQHYTPRGLETDRSMKKFVNKYINNKKGRRIRWIGKQNGKIDMTIRALRTFTSVLDLGLNIPVGIASTIGEQVTDFEVLGAKKYALGTSRLFTEQGRKIVDDYKEFTGKTAWDEIIEPDKQVSERLMEGLFILFRVASVKANQQFLLGSLTEQEFKSGKIDSQRLAELKLEMGRWRQTEASESLVGSTAAGGGAIQYKKWAVPIIRTTAKDISILASDLKNKSIGEALTTREAQELKRLIGIVTFATIVGAMMIGDDDDRSFIGQLRAKAYREMMTLMQGVDPKLWLSSPRVLTFLAKLGDNLHKILILEEYKTKEGYKGVEGLKKQLTPVVVKQLSEDDNKPQRR